MKIKKEFLGAICKTSTMGVIKIVDEPWVLKLLVSENKFFMLEDPPVKAKKLVPLEDKPKKELIKLAKDLEGYESSMTKAELVELIQNAPS